MKTHSSHAIKLWVSLTIWSWEFGISLLHMDSKITLFFGEAHYFLGFFYILIYAEIVAIFVYCPNH
jgi:hypothetical protein